VTVVGELDVFRAQFVVGDQRGLLQVVAVKKSQPYADFQIDLAAPINCLVLATHAGWPALDLIQSASSSAADVWSSINEALINTLIDRQAHQRK
jgi:hypothetical protein